MGTNMKKAGSGVTTKGMMIALRKAITDSYKAELGALTGGRVGLKPKQVELLLDGFEAGFRTAIHHLEGMGVIAVVETDEEANAAAAEKR